MTEPCTTSATGIPAATDSRSLTVGPDGPTVLHDAVTVPKPLVVAARS